MKAILIVGIFFFSGVVFAQKSAKDSLLTLMSKDVCKEIEKKDFSKTDKSNLQLELGLLMVPALTKNLSAIEEIYGAGITDKKAMEKMSIDLAMKLMTDCPRFMEIAMELSGEKRVTPADESPIRFAPPKIVQDESGGNISGTLISVNAGDFTNIQVKEKNGKIQKLYWLEYFENSDYFSINTKKFLQKKVTVQFADKEVYDALKKEYKNIKVITGIELE